MQKDPMGKSSVWLLAAVLLVASIAGAEDGRDEIPTYGVSCRAPEKWIRVAETNTREAIRWEKRGEDAHVDGILAVRILDRGTKTLDELTRKVAKDVKGDVLEEKATVDGEAARVVVVKRSDRAIGPVRLMIVEHAKRVYVLEASAVAETDVEKDFEALRAGVKFVELVTPAKQAGTTKQVSSPFGVKLTVPASFRRLRDMEHFHFSVRNCETGKIEFGMQVEELPLAADSSHEDVRRERERNIQKTCAAPSLKYVNVGTHPDRWLTPPTAMKLEGDVAETSTVRWGLVDVDAKRALVFTFVIEPNVPDEDRKAYEKAAEEIMKSVDSEPAK